LAYGTLAYILQHAVHIVQQGATSVLRENMLGIIIRWYSSKRTAEYELKPMISYLGKGVEVG
jgi:hypothetical protein